MSDQEKRRRALAEGMAKSRAPTGRDARNALRDSLVNGRRGINERMEKERRGSQIAADLNQLQAPPRQRRTLRSVQPVGALPANRGRASYVPPPPPQAGGGLVSPIEEVERTRHPAKVVWSADGMVPLVLRRTATLKSMDAEGNEEERRFADVP